MWDKKAAHQNTQHSHKGTDTARVDVSRLVKGTEMSSNYIEGVSGSMIDWINGNVEFGSGYFRGDISAATGTIGGWYIATDRLQSATSGVRVELNKADLRVSIFDATEEKVVMGYLNGLPKHSGVGNWGVADYGFWARSGDKLSIDGDGEYINGDWIIQNDASYLVNNDSAQTIIRLGTDTGEKGLFIYNTAGVKLAKFISDQIYVGTATNYLQYTIASGLKLYSNIANAITLDYGSNILLKEGGSIKFTSVPAPTACTATLIEAAGNVDEGTHTYKVTYVNATGETRLGTASNTVTTSATHKQVALSAIPVSTSGSVTSRKIYRTKAGGSDYFLLTTISNNIGTTYTDNTTDAGLTGEIAQYIENSTFGKIIIDNDVRVLLSIDNTFLGHGTGRVTTTGWGNTFTGSFSGYNNTTGYYNIFIGYAAGKSNINGYQNTYIGHHTGYNSTGNFNTFIGLESGYENTGNVNTFIGAYAGKNNSGSSNVSLGRQAGYYETGSNKLFIDNAARTNEADGRVKALIYGVFAAATANQTLAINAVTTISETLSVTKGIIPRVGTTASSATPTPAGDSQDIFTVTALAENATFAAPTGTPVNGQKLIIRTKDNGTARTLGFNAIYRASTDVALPTTTTISKTMYLGFIFNSADTKWDLVAKTDGF